MKRKCQHHICSQGVSRRSFLKHLGAGTYLGLSASPATALFTAMLNGIAEKAYAAEFGLNPYNLVALLWPGAMNTTSFQPLTAYTDFTDRNAAVGSNFANISGRYNVPEWNTITVSGVRYPLCWSAQIPTANGGSKAMSQLIADLLVFQGIDTKNPGHQGAQQAHWAPPGASQSLNALSADNFNAPLAAVNISASEFESTFRSNRGKPYVSNNANGNAIQNIMAPFIPGAGTSFNNNRVALREAFNGMMPLLSDLSRHDAGAQAILDSRDSAMRLYETNFGDLTQVWNALEAKYSSLIARSFDFNSLPIAGITDRPIGEGGSGDPVQYLVDLQNRGLHTLSDLRSIVGSQTTLPGMSRVFALIEWLLVNQITHSIAADINSISGLIQPVSTQLFGMGHDAHDTGNRVQLFLNTLAFRAALSCISELIDQLKAANMFDRSLITLAGEFGRDPRENGTGSDHGYRGGSKFCFGGALKTNGLVLGNCTSDGRRQWGAGGVVSQLGEPINLIHMIVTIAHILGVPSPFTAAQSLVTMTSSGAVANIETSRWV